MNPDQNVELELKISAHETEAAESLAVIRQLEQEWDEYRHAMREDTARFEEAAISMGANNYFVQRALAARKDLDTFVGQLAREQAEVLVETARGIRASSETEVERLRLAKAGASWA